MIRKYIVLFAALIIAIPTFAQLEVKEGSFKEVLGFVNINPNPDYQTDDNDLPFAVIKVRTENINDKQRRNLRFEGNAGTFIMLEYKTGEVWVYLTSKYADYIKISHPDLSSTEFTFPFDLKPKCGYEMTLLNKSPFVDKNNYLIVKTDQQNAKIYIDDKYVGTGYASKVVSIGEEHTYRVNCDDYYPKEGLVYFDKREDKEINIILEPSFGYITIKSEPSGADIYIDDVQVGTTPYLLKKIKLGSHVVELRKVGYESYADMITITIGEPNKQFENVKLIEDKNVPQQQTVQAMPMIVNNESNKSDTYIDTIKRVYTDAFSVGDNKTVYFSKGNLQYQASTDTWRFAEHQWDVIGKKNRRISSSYNGWIDLFGYGTGKNPATRSTKNEDYSLFNDWGDNKISNGGSKKWRTLTRGEWSYVFRKRHTNSGIRYAKAIVNNVSGVILLPDNWDSSVYKLKNTNKFDANYSSNNLSMTVWITKFEAKGAVFLPAAGGRLQKYYDTLLKLNEGFYWAATSTGYIMEDSGDGVYFVDTTLEPDKEMPRYIGGSVRLVRDAE